MQVRLLTVPAAICLMWPCLMAAATAQAAYTAHLGTDATIGDWAIWNTAQNSYELTVTLEPDGATDPIRLYDVAFSWDATRLQAVGAPVAGPLFAGQPDPWFGWYDQDGQRTVTQVLLGGSSGVAPAGPVVLFTQLFHATGSVEGQAAVDLLSLTLRGPLNQPIPASGVDQALITVDLTPPQGQLFNLQAQQPSGDDVWSASRTVNASLLPGDGTVAALLVRESAGLPDNDDPAWSALPLASSLDLSAGDGLKTVQLAVRDLYGNRRVMTDAITLDGTAPDYQVGGLSAQPRHQGALLGWELPLAAPDFDRLRLYRHGWCDDGLPRYPEFDDSVPMSDWPSTEAEALAAGFSLVYEGADSGFLHTLGLRDVQRYVAFCVDHAGNVGVAGTGARDRCTNYILGDVRTPWDGIVFVGDLVRLAAAYGTQEGQSGYDAHLDYGPTDDMSRSGIPLTDNRVDFEDLMIHAMNYGPTGPLLVAPPLAKNSSSGADAVARLQLEEQDGGLALWLEGAGNWLGLHLLVEWGDFQTVELREVAGAGLIHIAGPGRLLFDRVLLEGEEANGLLAVLEFSEGRIPEDLQVSELTLRDPWNQPLGSESVELATLPTQATAFQLEPNHPNPFNPSTQLAFSLDQAAQVRLEVFNNLGQRVALLLDQAVVAGRHELAFDGNGLASGLYFCRLEVAGQVTQRKMVLVR